VGANGAAALELGSNTSVMAIGGFSGSDPFPTLDQFKQMVTEGQISYFVPGNAFGGADGFGGRGGGNGSSSSAITQWVQATFPSTTVGTSTVYQLHQ
jgi:4-amino-4-deoxy-L-arabinose transferase-like glycosyltransferase